MTKIRLVMLTRRADCSLKRGKTICLNICCNKRYHIVDSKSTISSFNKWAYPFCCRAMCNSQGWMFLQGIINFSPLGSPFALLWECLKSSMSKIYYIPQWFELLMPYSIRSCWGFTNKLSKRKSCIFVSNWTYISTLRFRSM